MPETTKKSEQRTRRQLKSAVEAEAFKDEVFALEAAAPLMPESEADRWGLYFRAQGYQDIRAKEMGLLCWRIGARLPADRPDRTMAEVTSDVRRIVRALGYKLLSPGMCVHVHAGQVAIVVLLQPRDGVWPRPEEFLPERFREVPPEYQDHHLDDL